MKRRTAKGGEGGKGLAFRIAQETEMEDEVDDGFVEFEEGFAVFDHVEDALIAVEFEPEFARLMVLELLVEFLGLESELAELVLEHDLFPEAELRAVMALGLRLGVLGVVLMGPGVVVCRMSVVVVVAVAVVAVIDRLNDRCCCCCCCCCSCGG